MIQLVYGSSATLPFSTEQLVALLAKSRVNNQSLGITGMLLYSGGNFLQVLEGEADMVRSLVEKIKKDPRHEKVVVLHDATSDKRDFPDWSMAFLDLGSFTGAAPRGFSPFLESELSTASFASHLPQAKKLILAFKSSAKAE